jgi:hypothetical protein
MAQAVSRRPIIAEAHIRSQANLCGICGGQSDTEIGFSASTSVVPCQYHSTSTPYLCAFTCCSYQKDERAKPGNLPKSNLFSDIGGGALDRKELSHP